MLGITKTSLLPAYGLITALLLLMPFSANTLLAQEYSTFDSLKIGTKYKIILFDDTEFIGKLTGQDSGYVFLTINNSTRKVRKDDIFNISGDLTPSKYKFIFSAGGGISLLSRGFFDDGYRKSSPSFSVQLNSTFVTSKSKGFRIDLGYSRFKREFNDPYMVDFQGGDIGMLVFKTDFVVGELSPSSALNAYGLIGLGVHIIKEESYTYKYRYYDTLLYNTYSAPDRTTTNVVFSIGGGLAYRFSKHLGVYAEMQYNMITYGGWFFFYGFGAGYFPIRAGLTYYLY